MATTFELLLIATKSNRCYFSLHHTQDAKAKKKELRKVAREISLETRYAIAVKPPKALKSHQRALTPLRQATA